MKKKIIVKLDKCIGCRSCEIACAREHSPSKSGERITADTRKALSRISIRTGLTNPTDAPEMRPRKGKSKTAITTGKAYPIRCRHCDDPKCVEACMSGALIKNEEDAVIHDPDKCVGCWMCIMACPYGAIKRDLENKIIVKCDLCLHRDTPACVEACKTGAIVCIVGEKSERQNESIAEGSG